MGWVKQKRYMTFFWEQIELQVAPKLFIIIKKQAQHYLGLYNFHIIGG